MRKGVILIILVLATSIGCSRKPTDLGTSLLLWKSADNIKSYLINETPLETSMDQVRKYADRRGWRHDDDNHGFLKQDQGPDGRPRELAIGAKSMSANLGDYGFPFRTNVTVFWGFDRDGKLIDIWVWKTTDAL